MNAKEFIERFGAEEAEAVAIRAGTKLVYLRQIANGHRNASVPLAESLVRESGDRLDFLALIRATPDRQPAA